MRTTLLLSALLLPASAKTLYEHEYGQHGINAGMDDGEVYDPTYQQEGDPAQSGFAQGHFLTADGEGPDHAKCLDGTPPVYYHTPGWGDGADKWFVHQQGGGWCYTIEECVSRSKGSLGSTSKDPQTRTLNGGYFDYDNKSNPLMWNWNKIEIRYCDGASVSGDRVDQEPSSKLWFRGRAILDAEINSILNDRGMNNATDVIVSGCSAGGLATFLHCDHWAAAIDKATTKKSMTGTGAKVACMPDSGFFLDEDRAPEYHSKMKNVYKFQQSSSAGLNAACVEAHKDDTDGAWKCIFAQWSAAHIKTPTFPMQSQYDSWQTDNVMGTEGNINTTEIAFGKNLTSLVISQLLTQPQHGIFLDSCHHHCGNWGGSRIDGDVIGTALQKWYTVGSDELPNKGFYNQNKPFPCASCCVAN